MGAIAARAFPSAPLSIDRPELIHSDAAELDALVARFVEAERAASLAYHDAYLLDVPHEHLKNRLIALVQECGLSNADGSQRTLRVRDFELTVTSALSSRVDHIAVRQFRYALIKDGCGRHGIAAEIFEAEMLYTLRPCAREVLAGMRLSKDLLDLLEKCARVSEVPLLSVTRIVPE